MADIVSVVRTARASEILGVLGKMVGVGLFAVLLYNYFNVVIEAGVQAAR